MNEVIRKFDWFKNSKKRLIPKNAIIYLFVAFTILLTTLNISWLLFSPDSGNLTSSESVSVALSFIASIFGMLTIMTYSLYDPDSKNVNKVKWFVVFNTIAVITLAIVNANNHLWFLFGENLAFFITGIYQYYRWFIVKQDEKTKYFDYYLFKKYGAKNTWIYSTIGFLIFGFVLSALSIEISSLTSDKAFLEQSTYVYVGGFVDGYVFTISVVASFYVGRKSIESQFWFFLSDFLIISWWLFNGFALPNGYTSSSEHVSAMRLSAFSIAILFTFYMSANVVNVYNWSNLQNPNFID